MKFNINNIAGKISLGRSFNLVTFLSKTTANDIIELIRQLMQTCI